MASFTTPPVTPFHHSADFPDEEGFTIVRTYGANSTFQPYPVWTRDADKPKVLHAVEDELWRNFVAEVTEPVNSHYLWITVPFAIYILMFLVCVVILLWLNEETYPILHRIMLVVVFLFVVSFYFNEAFLARLCEIYHKEMQALIERWYETFQLHGADVEYIRTSMAGCFWPAEESYLIFRRAGTRPIDDGLVESTFVM